MLNINVTFIKLVVVSFVNFLLLNTIIETMFPNPPIEKQRIIATQIKTSLVESVVNALFELQSIVEYLIFISESTFFAYSLRFKNTKFFFCFLRNKYFVFFLSNKFFNKKSIFI